MKYLKPYKIFESLKNKEDNLRFWINDVMKNCKDLMIDLEDKGMETKVKRSLYMIEENSVLVECVMTHSIVPIKKWRSFGINKIFNDLEYYMESEGFEELDRQTLPQFNGGLWMSKITFKKEKLFLN
jgi:hypothetical protein